MIKISAISESIAKEWPEDHHLRKGAVVLSDDAAAKANYLICSRVGERRIPAPDGSPDETARCCGCGTIVVYRSNSAPIKNKICLSCWDALH